MRSSGSVRRKLEAHATELVTPKLNVEKAQVVCRRGKNVQCD